MKGESGVKKWISCLAVTCCLLGFSFPARAGEGGNAGDDASVVGQIQLLARQMEGMIAEPRTQGFCMAVVYPVFAPA